MVLFIEKKVWDYLFRVLIYKVFLCFIKIFSGYCICKLIERVFFFLKYYEFFILLFKDYDFDLIFKFYYKLMVKIIVNVILYFFVIRLSFVMNVLIGLKRKKEYFYDKFLRFVLFNLNDCNLMFIIYVFDCEF